MNGCTKWIFLFHQRVLFWALSLPLALIVCANAAPTVSISVNPTVITEGVSDATFVFTRAGAPLTSPLTVEFSVPEAVSVAGLVDAAGLATRSIIIPVNQASVTVVVHPIDDAFHSGKKTMQVVLKSSTAYQINALQPAAQITIDDNDAISGPDVGAWPEVFNPWKVTRIDLQMAETDWLAMQASTATYNGQFRHDDGVYWPVTVRRKGNEGPVNGEKQSIKIDLNALAGPAWRGLQKLNLHVGADTSLLDEGVAWYLHRFTSGTHGYEPGYSSFVELYLNNRLIGVYLNVEERDDQFVKNRGLHRRNSTWMYKIQPPFESEYRVFPETGPDSSTRAILCYGFWVLSGQCATPSQAQRDADWEANFEMDAVLTQAAVDALNVNTDGILAPNNINRVDFHFPPNPAGPPRPSRKSLCIPRDFDYFKFGPCSLATSPIQTMPNIRFAQRQREIMNDLVGGPLSPALVDSLITRMQFMLMDRLNDDPNSTIHNVCVGGEPQALQPPAARFEEIRNWFTARLQSVQSQLASSLGALPSKPVFTRNGNIITIQNPGGLGTVWFTTDGNDPWTVADAIAPTATSYSGPITLTANRHLFARVKNGSLWSPATRETFTVGGSTGTLSINQYIFRPSPPTPAEAALGFERDDFEFIELKNISTGFSIDLSDHYMEGVVYEFPPGTQIGPNQLFVLVRNPKAFAFRYPGTAYHATYWDGKMNDFGERLAIHAPDGTIVRSKDYSGLSGLTLNEILYNPKANESEFIELRNNSLSDLDLSGCRFTDGISYTFPPGTILPWSAELVLVDNPAAFEARYPGVTYHGVYEGSLANEGERLTLETEDGERIFSHEYDDALPWPIWASTFNHSIMRIGTDPNLPENWRASSDPFGAPNSGEPLPKYALGVVINELLSRPGTSQEDAIELRNTTGVPVDISHWYLSDSYPPPAADRYQIPAGTIIPAYGHKVFYAAQFDSGPAAFAFDKDGDAVYLTSADPDGKLTGYVAGEVFGAAEAGVSFGRQLTSSGWDFVPMSSVTFGFTPPANIAEFRQGPGVPNPGARIGPVVISEIMYHPAADGTEFIELHNLTAAPISLSNWRIEGVEYTFPSGSSIPANGYLLLVDIGGMTVEQFRTDHSVPVSVPIYGAVFNLGNDGEDIELQRPNGNDPRIRVERIRYNDNEPWPEDADGAGFSLERLCLTGYGNEPSNWKTSLRGGTPGVSHSLVRTSPVIANIPNTVGTEDGTFNISIPISDGDNSPEALHLVVTADNPTLIPPQNLSLGGNGATRTLRVAPAANLSGTAQITVSVSDGCSMASDLFQLTVNAVNDPPGFVKGPDQELNDNAGPVVVPSWATSISPGPPDEAAQTVAFVIGNISNPALFQSQPAIAANGTLTFTPSAGASGTALISVYARDSGGVNSPAQTFQISIFPATYHLKIALSSSSDPAYIAVAALGIDEVGVVTGYGVAGASEYSFMMDSIEGEGIGARMPTSNPNCPALYNPANAFPWTSRGNAISDGLVVGYIGYGGASIPTAATWQNGPTPVVGCGNGTPGYSEVKAYIANGFAGHLVGYDNGSAATPGGGTARRGNHNGWTATLPGIAGSTWSVANGVNLSGEAVGASKDPVNNRLYPCFWSASGTLTLLPFISSSYNQGEALAINNNGWIVGYVVLTSNGRKRGCVWKKVGGNYQATGVSSTDSVVTAINSWGQMVGYQSGFACEFINNTSVNLNLRSESSTYQLARAYGINDQGQIVGCTAWGTEASLPQQHYPGNYSARAFVLTPEVPIVGVTVSSPSLNEGGADVTFTFTRTRGPVGLPLKIQFTIPQATQVAGLVDAPVLAPRFITIPAGQLSVNATMHAVDDAVNYGANNLTVTLETSSAYEIDPAHTSAPISINDNDLTPVPDPTSWQEVFNPWKVQKLRLQLAEADWNRLTQDVNMLPQPRYAATFLYDDNSFKPVQVWKKYEQIPGERFSLRIDLDNELWHGLRKIQLRACGTKLMIESMAWYAHHLSAGINGYEPARSAFVELYVNNVFKGVFLNVEPFDSEFIENRGLRRKNATWLYRASDDDDRPRDYPDIPPESPTFLAIGAAALQPPINWENYFNIDAVLTQAAVDNLYGNNDGLLENNNVNRVDFYYPRNLHPNGPPATLGRSFDIQRDLDSSYLKPSTCLPGGTVYTIDNPRANQRLFEILEELTNMKFSPSAWTAISNRMQFMLMDVLRVDPHIKLASVCTGFEQTAAAQFDDLRSAVSARFSELEAVLEMQLENRPQKPVFVRNGDTITMQKPGGVGTIYYTTDGTDPWTLADTQSGFEYTNPINLPGTRHICARVKNGSYWSRIARQTFVVANSANALRVTEIMYHPPSPSLLENQAGYDDSDEFEFVELKNTGSSTIDLSDHYFEGIVYKFPPATQIAPGQFFVMVRNPKAFEMRYPGILYHAVYWDGKLDNEGEAIALKNPAGDSVIAFTYDDTNPWPITPDGTGPSLVLQNVTGDPNLAATWRPSHYPNGSPGTEDVLAAATYVRTDAKTRGMWIGTYGTQGKTVIGDQADNPFAHVTIPSGITRVWPQSPDFGGLQKVAQPQFTIQACLHSPENVEGGSFDVYVRFYDAQPHQMALYLYDRDANVSAGPRTQRVEIWDARSGALLRQRTYGSTERGKYVLWNVQGYIKIRLVNVKGLDAVLSGIFIDPVGTGNPGEFIWVEEATDISGAQMFSEGDFWPWNWTSVPKYAGATAHQSQAVQANWLHQHYFINNPVTITPEPDDELFCWVYVDPVAIPSMVMLQWMADDGTWWNHRAYWGANQCPWGINGTASRLQINSQVPAPNQWVRLSVPAYKVDLVGRKISGMAYTLIGGKATWDHAGTLSALADTDSDGLPDPWELEHLDGSLALGTTDDGDGDGAINLQEVQRNTDPNGVNTDGDTFFNGTPFTDGQEIHLFLGGASGHTDPTLADTDSDGLSDPREVDYSSNPLDWDSDDDGLPDGEESFYDTNPNDPDTDDDQLSDMEEVYYYGTNPNDPDCDDDSWSDYWEIFYWTDPWDPNSYPNP